MKTTVAILLALLAAGCATFTSVSGSVQPGPVPSGQSVTLSGPASPVSGSLTLDVNVNQLASPAFGIAFDLDFNSGIIVFDSFTPGTFFEQGGAGVSYQVTPAPGNPGKLIIGVTRLGAVGGVGGSGRVMTLRFLLNNVPGSTQVGFSGAQILGPDGNPLAGTVTFSPATVNVQ
jgi:hypothetical protein